ncbi:hypothetical protein ACH50O_11655 [Methylomonas sp. 2BW1-5-20]|uniref:hypothetical protein n=1 Tax=Methylomonas sp. 2BW1-5-20 TaxID=3376686 RepID=UPI004050481C
MFKVRHVLRNDDAGQSGGGAPNNAPTTASQSGAGAPAPVVDVQAQINAALAQQQADFAAQLEKATGHKDIKSLTDAQLQAQGKLQELADAKAAEANTYKTKFEGAAISNALLAASAEAVDPATVKDLLAGKAKVDDAGNVTIDGKSVADAVKALLEAKPFLAKAQGGTGSGAPQNTSGNTPSKSRAEFAALDPSSQAKHIKDGGVVTD